jgi:hypothetical protein
MVTKEYLEKQIALPRQLEQDSNEMKDGVIYIPIIALLSSILLSDPYMITKFVLLCHNFLLEMEQKLDKKDNIEAEQFLLEIKKINNG